MTAPALWLNYAAVIAPPAEARRRFAVRAIWFIYALMLLEGPLRKWLLPELATPLTFLRDPFVAALYAYCFAYRLVAWTMLAQLWFGIAALTSVLGLFQYGFATVNPAGWLLGVRTYWLYMPLAFVVASTFQRNDVQRLLIANVLLCIPYAMLVTTQYNAGPWAWINRGVGGDDEAAVGLGALIVRPFGLFTYTGPNVNFTATSMAMLLALYLSSMKFRFRWLVLIAGGFAVTSMIVLAGSRAIYFLVAAIFCVTLLGGLVARPDARTAARSFGMLIGVALGGVLFVTAFPDMLDAMGRRFESAAAVEGSIWNRALGGVFSFLPPMLDAPLLGHGIGMGAPGVAQFLRLDPLLYGESDLQRNVNELGVLIGIGFLALRFGTAGLLLWLAFRAAQRGSMEGLPLAGYAVLPIAIGQITHSPISAFPVWLCVGLVYSCTVNNERKK